VIQKGLGLSSGTQIAKISPKRRGKGLQCHDVPFPTARTTDLDGQGAHIQKENSLVRRGSVFCPIPHTRDPECTLYTLDTHNSLLWEIFRILHCVEHCSECWQVMVSKIMVTSTYPKDKSASDSPEPVNMLCQMSKGGWIWQSIPVVPANREVDVRGTQV
jgi:hypothetical protein